MLYRIPDVGEREREREREEREREREREREMVAGCGNVVSST